MPKMLSGVVWKRKLQINMGNLVDLTGKRFGWLVALEKMKPQPDGVTRWLCRCDCGNEHVVTYTNLTTGHTTSCGCKKKHDLTGKVFGKLTVLYRSEQKHKRGSREYPLWVCRCECGEIVLRMSESLTTKKERMCTRCLQKESAKAMLDAAGFVGGTQITKIQKMKLTVANTSGTRGVYWHKRNKKWEARLKFQGKLMYLGLFDKYDDAVKARQRAEEEVYGVFLSEISENCSQSDNIKVT